MTAMDGQDGGGGASQGCRHAPWAGAASIGWDVSDGGWRRVSSTCREPAGFALPGRRGWRPTQLCGCCVQPACRGSSEGVDVERRDNDDVVLASKGPGFLARRLVLEDSLGESLAMATPMGAVFHVGGVVYLLYHCHLRAKALSSLDVRW